MIRALSNDLCISHRQAEETIDKLFDYFALWLAEDDRIKIRNFGVFYLRQIPPNTLHPIRVAGKDIVYATGEIPQVIFRPSKTLKLRVREGMLQRGTLKRKFVKTL